MKYRWCLLIAAIVACFLLYGYGRTGEGRDVWTWLGGFIACTAIFSVVIWGIFRSLKNASYYLVNGSISSSDDSKEAKKMENESSQKKEIRQNKEEMKAEKKASTNKVLLWIIGLIVVAAFAWFVWPTPWVTKIKYDYRATSVHKINRITGAICQTVLQSDGYVKRGNCWKRKIDHEDSRFAWLENGRGEPKLQAIDYEKGHIKTTGYLREDLGDSKYFDAKLYNGNEARVAELEVTIKCGDMSQKYLLKGSIKKFSFGEMTTEIDSAIYDCAASTRKWNFYANAIRGYYN